MKIPHDYEEICQIVTKVRERVGLCRLFHFEIINKNKRK